ncbi:ABC transporter ATP-binding protein [Haloplasma contractile]|uniref:ABC transporter ATP-binding protein n=1 Tax=Haloplasma contractile SSD-17B TaxID=1033810 RepID=U2EB41_9MOLU|nr:ABC transporter ATP-binding protein [Haloplasma contractile]ERJ12001.1 ABC transporter ATP-binding protein [Haloplasma contractile SSD-17B]
MLTLNNISKKYGRTTVLENIHYQFDNGIYGLLAPNGAGKTTLMKLITTLHFPNSGEIIWDGCDITSLGSKYRDQIGYLPQDFGYYPHYTAHKFMKYIAALKGISKHEVSNRVDELLEKVGLSHVKRKKLKKFSGGMIQRIGIAQALLNDPKILILDEPTAGLDPKERVRFRQMLSTLGKDRIVIISTHIVSDVESIAKDIILIKDRTIFKSGKVFDINNELEGKVWQVNVNEEDAHKLEKNHVIINKNISTDHYSLRIVSETIPHNAAILTKPNLEDVFIYYYGEDLLL